MRIFSPGDDCPQPSIAWRERFVDINRRISAKQKRLTKFSEEVSDLVDEIQYEIDMLRLHLENFVI